MGSSLQLFDGDDFTKIYDIFVIDQSKVVH